MTVSTGSSARSTPFDRVVFERVLVPHRSLTLRGFRILMLVLGLISVAVGLAFLLLGAWPVVGFFGLDAALVYAAFRLNYRSARCRETIRLADDVFTVERVGARGERRIWRFQPFWLRVALDDQVGYANRLVVGSHGCAVAIADFLPPAARQDLAAAIREALRRWRHSFRPAPAPDRSPG